MGHIACWSVIMWVRSDDGADPWLFKVVYEGNNLLRVLPSILKARLESDWVVVEWRKS